MVVMMVRDENGADLADVNARLGKAACHAIAGINDIMGPVHD